MLLVAENNTVLYSNRMENGGRLLRKAAMECRHNSQLYDGREHKNRSDYVLDYKT